MCTYPKDVDWQIQAIVFGLQDHTRIIHQTTVGTTFVDIPVEGPGIVEGSANRLGKQLVTS